jgi:hypothetical protein
LIQPRECSKPHRRAAELGFSLLSLGDVLDHSEHAGLSGSVADDLSFFVDPPHGPVESHDPMVDLVGCVTCQSHSAGPPDGLDIIGMDHREKALHPPVECPLLYAKDPIRLGRPLQRIGVVRPRDPIADVRYRLSLFEELVLLTCVGPLWPMGRDRLGCSRLQL